MLQVLRDCAEIAFCANPYVSFLWVHCRPRCQCRSGYSQTCKARAWPSGANVHRWVPRFLRSPCLYAWGVVTAAYRTVPNQSVYSGTKMAVRAISQGLRQEAGDKLRVTIISPGFTRTNFAEAVTNPEVKAQLAESREKFAMPPDAIARAIAFAIEQPAEVDVNEVVVRPTAQG